jgi:Spy/CpxP family protein refolding chaperone
MNLKFSHFCACTVLLLAAGTARADQDNSSTSSTQSSAAWAETRGTMTTEDVIATLGITPTREQRDQIEQSVRERNDALREINARFSAALQKTLAANDKELARRVTDEKERQRLETMRRRQPGRYNGAKKPK